MIHNTEAIVQITLSSVLTLLVITHLVISKVKGN
jgi:hypothetical protein